MEKQELTRRDNADLEDGKKQLDSRYTLKVEPTTLLISQIQGRRGKPLEWISLLSGFDLLYMEGVVMIS